MSQLISLASYQLINSSINIAANHSVKQQVNLSNKEAGNEPTLQLISINQLTDQSLDKTIL